MTDYKEILRLAALGITKQDIAASCQCSRNTVRNVLNAAQEQSLTWDMIRGQSNESLRKRLFPGSSDKPTYRMPEFDTRDYSDTMLPEGIETVHPRFAISWRNKWMIKQSDYVVTYITHAWGGAAQFAEKAAKQNKIVINLA